MVQARSELAAGDLRLLYLVWLLGIQQTDEDEDEAVEPPVPAGLGDLSPALRSVAEFLRIDQDLIAMAAEASPPLQEPAGDELAGWIEALPGTEKDRLLTMVAGGESARVQALLLKQFRERETGATPRSESTRTVAELLIAVDDHATERERTEDLRQREEQAHRTAVAAAAREARLNQLAAAGETPGTMIDEMIATKNTTEYDRAAALLLDLRALAQRDATEPSFTVRVQELRARYPRRPGLQYRLGQAGLPRS